jgi:hypothetical protein
MRAMYWLVFLFLAVPVATAEPPAQTTQPAAVSCFAIVADQEIFAMAEPALRAWATAIEADGLPVRLIHDAFATPEDVRALLHSLHQGEPPLEGAVLVGRIPVPMLRDAQHLTSAFKMDQVRYPMRRSSVPSDRFYECFQLRFDHLGTEEEEPWLHYYSLRPDSPQRIEKDIYTARLFPPAPGPEGLERLKATIERLAEARQAGPAPLRRAVVVGGHGYHSQCLEAWMAMQMELREILPGLRLPGGSLASYYHSRGLDLKERVVRDLQLPGLQLALFHAHGAPDAQYLLGAQVLPSMDSQIDAIQLFLRQRLRNARDRDKGSAETQLELMESRDLPLSWFRNAFDEAVIAADEAAAARKELTATEIALLDPTPQVMLLDQCFNGRFIDAPSVAQEYVHGSGSVQVVVANTVNVRQDQWAAQFLGALAHGARVGQYHRLHPYIEYHLIGDPTVRFAPEAGVDLSTLLCRNPDEQVWRDWLARPETPLRALAVSFLGATPNSEAALLEYLASDPSPVVRMEALRSLAASRSEAFHKGLRIGLADPFEAVRRQSAALMGDVGLDAFALPLLKAAIGDPGRRVAFNASGALDKLSPEAVEAAVTEFLARDPLAAADAALQERLYRIVQPGPVRRDDIGVLENRDEPLKRRIQAARSFRNLRAHDLAGRLLALALAPDEELTLRVTLIEALGWFTLSHRRAEILEGVQRLADDPAAPEAVRAEARRTRARLLTGPNEPWTP